MDQKAAEAQAILDNPIFRDALDAVYSRAVQTLLTTEVGSLTASTAHATMKTVHSLRNQIEQCIIDQKVRMKFGKGVPHG